MSFSATGARVRQKVMLDSDDLELLSSGAFRVEFDATTRETHSKTAQVTEQPVESNANIADHIVRQPDTLDLIAWVTNTPIVGVAEAGALTGDLCREAYDTLRGIMNDGVTVNVLTTLRLYETMAITSLAVTRDAATGDALALSLSLREVRTARTAAVDAPTPSVARAKPLAAGGKAPTRPATDAESDKVSDTLTNTGLTSGISGITNGAFVP